MLGGKISSELDWFRNIDISGFWNNEDVYDTETIFDPVKYIERMPPVRLKYALDHKINALEYAMQYSRGKSRELIEKFVLMYVNTVTVDMGKPGEKSIRTLFEMAKQKNLVPDFELKISELL